MFISQDILKLEIFMHTIIKKHSNHHWEKKNLITIMRGSKSWDELACERCGIVGKQYNLAEIQISTKYSKKMAESCPYAEPNQTKRIKITNCYATGRQFANLVADSEHDIIETPKGQKIDNRGVWVMGVGEPVKILNDEFIVVA